jgi:hypothetical protein
MCHRVNIDLEVFPWPLNLLKFNQVIRRMQPGEDVTATSADADVVNSLKQLLISLPELDYDVSETGTCFRIRVFRRPP